MQNLAVVSHTVFAYVLRSQFFLERYGLLGTGVADALTTLLTCVVVAKFVALCQTVSVYNCGHPPEIFDPSLPPFKVTQGHWNRH